MTVSRVTTALFYLPLTSDNKRGRGAVVPFFPSHMALGKEVRLWECDT